MGVVSMCVYYVGTDIQVSTDGKQSETWNNYFKLFSQWRILSGLYLSETCSCYSPPKKRVLA